MILYSSRDPYSSLWWMHGSVIPDVTWVSCIAALHAAVAVYFKENYNLFVSDTSHTLVSTTIGFLLTLKAVLAYVHYHEARTIFFEFMDSIRNLCVHAHSYGCVASEERARDLILGRTSMCKHLCVLYYSLVMHLRRQPLLPRGSLLYLYLHPKELSVWEASDIRPLTCLTWLDTEIAKLCDKGIYQGNAAAMMSGEVTRMVNLLGRMERVRDVPTIPFAYFQFCNWTSLLYALSAPAAIATHDTYYTSSAALSFFLSITVLGINALGNQLQRPFGLGPNDMPLTRYALALQHELYIFSPFFHFRFGAFPLFHERWEVLPPEDPRSAAQSAVVEIGVRKSFWAAARAKVLAAGRLGNRRLRKLREAKDAREGIVKDLMTTRRLVKEDSGADIAALIKALQEGAFAMGAPGMRGRGRAVGKEKGEGDGGDEGGGAGVNNGEKDGLPPALTVGRGNKASHAPAESAPKNTVAKQAALLAKRFPDSATMQQMLGQIMNPRVPEADKNAILSLMSAEADMLAGEEAAL